MTNEFFFSFSFFVWIHASPPRLNQFQAGRSKASPVVFILSLAVGWGEAYKSAPSVDPVSVLPIRSTDKSCLVTISSSVGSVAALGGEGWLATHLFPTTCALEVALFVAFFDLSPDAFFFAAWSVFSVLWINSCAFICFHQIRTPRFAVCFLLYVPICGFVLGDSSDSTLKAMNAYLSRSPKGGWSRRGVKKKIK